MAKDPDGTEKPHYHRHRMRLRTRFMEGGEEALADYELLELMLFQANARVDVKPLAKQLIERFGGFTGVVSASPEALREIKGVGDAAIVVLKSVRAAAVRLAREETLEQPVISSWDRRLAYCRVSMAHDRTERFLVLFLDTKNKIIHDEVQQTGTVNHTPVYPREVVKRALEVGPRPSSWCITTLLHLDVWNILLI
uniref:Putative RadC, DNA repair protein n=1 Tax=uncultured marine microorganism HF4000_APKG8L7 TaxID=455556 RepID=B3TB70_9ZZZZ|nr:putative RadC, DNA repair protein [uncultured marine microorganism HF4000_APKG8L7]